MSNINLFLLKKNTDAIATNRGFLYQYLITLNNWLDVYLNNQQEDIIFCETEEDIMKINKLDQTIQFTQVKSYAQGFSEKSVEIKKTLYNFYILHLKYSNSYKGTYHFETNAGTKVNAGKFLKEWHKNQEDSTYVINNCKSKTQELIYKVGEIQIKKQKLPKSSLISTLADFKSKVYSDEFDSFIKNIRWSFLAISPKVAINDLNSLLKEKISMLPKHNELTNVMFARLLSEIYKRSSETKIEARKLTINVLDSILNETIDEIKSNIKPSFDLLMQCNFRILDEIDKIKDLISESHDLINKHFTKKFKFEDFLDQYKRAALKEVSRISFIGLQVPRGMKQNHSIKLEDIYIEPKFSMYTKKRGNNEEFERRQDTSTISYNKLFEKHDKIVILGGPGTGKSMLVKSIIHKILTKQKTKFKNQELFYRLPFRIELRRYLAAKKELGCNLIGFLRKELTDKYIKNLTYEQIELILENYPSIVLFDGLDEIFSPTNKEEVRIDIENFIDSSSNIKAIVTSRIAGYDEAILNEKFVEFHIEEFNDIQITKYVKTWYSCTLPGPDNRYTREDEINTFLNEIDYVDNELKRNPLLLSLIVILFSNLKKMPKSKLQIYESCTNTLVEKWDATKKDLKIEIEPELLKYKEPIFSELAFWEYEILSSKNKLSLTNQKATEKVANTIYHRLELVDDPILSKKWANTFLDYAEKRSLYFDAEFTHKTFREYFTALWIYSNYEVKHKKVKRNEIISKYIDNPFWFIVLELLINMIDHNQADNEIIDELLLHHKTNKLAYPFLLDILPKVNYISKNAKIEIITASITEIINLAQDSFFKKETKRRALEELTLQNKVFSKIQKLLYNSNDYKNIIEISLDQLFEKFQQNTSNTNTTILMMFTFEIYRHHHFQYKEENSNIPLFEKQKKFIHKLKKENSYIYWGDVHYKEKLTIETFTTYINTFGLKAMEKESMRVLFAPNTHSSIIRIHLGHFLINRKNIKDIEKNVELLRSLHFDIKTLYQDQIYHYRRDEKAILSIIEILEEIKDTEILGFILLSLVTQFPFGNLVNNSIILNKCRDSKYINLLETIYSKNTSEARCRRLIFKKFKLKEVKQNSLWG